MWDIQPLIRHMENELINCNGRRIERVNEKFQQKAAVIQKGKGSFIA